MGGIYAGVRVVELAEGIAGPYATMFLADHGADVIKVEPPGGDPYRSGRGFPLFNRAKRSVTVAGDDLERLARTADVVVCDRPGRAAQLTAAAPGAVVVTLPPWGETGAHRHDPHSPALLAATTGIAWNQQSYAEVPVHLVVPMVAYATATLAATTLAAALLSRERDGTVGTYEVSQVAGAAALQLEQFRAGDLVEERDGFALMGSKGRVPIYRLFRCADDRWLFLACGTVRFYERLLELVGRTDLRHHPSLPAPPWGLMDNDAVAFLAPVLEETFEQRPREEWLRLLRAADIPTQPVQSREEFLASGLYAANELGVVLDDPERGEVRTIGLPLRFEAAPGSVGRPAPRLGEHTDEVLAALADEPAVPIRPRVPAGSPGPLTGIAVIDLSSFIAGPVVSRHLAMLGADVVKVEPPAGDPFRAFGPAFANWNHGKRSIALDLTAPDGHDVLRHLLQRADVAVENYRPPVAARLGVTPAELRAVNADLVTLSSPGYGSDATLAEAAGFDPLLQALSGIMAAQGGDDEPVFLTVAIHDVVTPIIGAFGVCSALYHRARGGGGQAVHASLAHTAAAVQAAELTRYRGAPDAEQGGFDHPGHAEGAHVIERDDGWWCVDGPHEVPVARHGLVNADVATDGDLLVTHDHPELGPITSFGQLVRGAGPPPGRGPSLDEHRAEILAELES